MRSARDRSTAQSAANMRRSRGGAPKAADLPFDESVGYQVRMTNRAFQLRLRERVEPFGVSPGMWYFLRLLWQKDGLTQRELSRRIGLMDPTAFTALNAMERRGLVRRVKHPTDGRKVNVFLTEQGKSLRKKMLPVAHEIIAEGTRGISTHEIDVLLRMLKKIQANLVAKSGTNRIA